MILMIDNYDSFVYNIYQYISELSDEEVLCIRNDEISVEKIKELKPSQIILGPGPKHPKDSGICLEILQANLDIPILGVCLGHQAIGYVAGADIFRLDRPLHGKTSEIEIYEDGVIFNSLPRNFEVMRYHSLAINNLPSDYKILARAKNDGVIMAIKHESKPIFGIQFHPESFFTQYGKLILENFLNYNKKIKMKEKIVVNFAPYMAKLQKGYPLDSSDYEAICKALNDKEYDIVQLAGLLVLISEKSLYADSVAAFVKSILKYSVTYNDPKPMFDIVGTGGDRLKTINISTTVAFIVASFGVRVAKHGNKAISSKAGSSDTLTYIGVPMKGDLSYMRDLLEKKGLAFFHAPLFHHITGEVRECRERLKIGSVFNMLGPLLNPNLSLSHQVAGNYLEEVNLLMAQTLMALGRRHALVVHGMDGMDEITLCDETLIHEVKDGKILEYRITPEQFGFTRAFHADIEGGSPEENAQILEATLKGEMNGAKFDIVLLNAMFALYCADVVNSPTKAKDMIIEAIKSGKVWEFYKNYLGR